MLATPKKEPLQETPRTSLACTFFCRPQVFDEINDSLTRFWEIETLGIQQSKPEMMTREEKIAFEKVCHSLIHDGERYQVAVPWKSASPVLPNNYEMACSRLRKTEKRLLRKSSVGDEYEQVIASESEGQPHNVWYLPHFPVCRSDRLTTN